MKTSFKFFIVIALLLNFVFSVESKMSDSMKKNEMNHGVSGDSDPIVQKELDLVRIDEKVGNTLDTDLVFFNQNGEEVILSDLIKDKPVVLSFVYYTCPLFCQLVLKGQSQLLSDLDLKLGEDYHSISLSFDHKDTKESTAKTHAIYTEGLGKNKNDWTFLYGEESNILNLTDQLGFHFKWIEENKEYAHTAAIYVITPEKKISRYFYGVTYKPFDVKLALIEAKKENFKSTVDRILLYCYRYDSDNRGYALYARNLMKAGGIVTVIILFGFIYIMVRREKKLKVEN